MENIHFKEDTSKPENRVNLSLFHLLMNGDFKNFIFSKLQLEGDSVIYPAPNLVTGEFVTTDRPDFKIKRNDKLFGYIEVELGKDISQVFKYDQNTASDVKIYSIFGKQSYGGDLSLEEIYYYLKSKQLDLSKNSQDFWSFDLMLSLIKYYVIEGNYKPNNKRTSISEAMRNSFLINAIYEGIESRYILDKKSDKPERGKILLNTVGKNGFSIRVYSRKSNSNSCSLMNRTGGRNTIYFPSYKKMKEYITNNEFVEQYAKLLESLGCTDIKVIDNNEKTSLEIKRVEDNIGEFISCIKLLLH
jgi:hypothetical protein